MKTTGTDWPEDAVGESGDNDARHRLLQLRVELFCGGVQQSFTNQGGLGTSILFLHHTGKTWPTRRRDSHEHVSHAMRITASDLQHKYKAQLWRGPSGLYVCWANEANAGSQGSSPKEAVRMAEDAIEQYLNMPTGSVSLDVEQLDEVPAEMPDDVDRPRGERRLIMPKEGDEIDPTLLERLVLLQGGVTVDEWLDAVAATE